jgi:hypothetical protein
MKHTGGLILYHPISKIHLVVDVRYQSEGHGGVNSLCVLRISSSILHIMLAYEAFYVPDSPYSLIFSVMFTILAVFSVTNITESQTGLLEIMRTMMSDEIITVRSGRKW